ncbi:hypothetical protein TRSC58_07640 [Trypanosoma rangeli SC58]|uniref:Secreted protein n=1 Tax=Trypanosoma rangeli SC58 TaxID=429131 RepID=A0A061IRR4_TRYRA|nr:hypothetical protein TRSC58_07640 [Trypanosoma rangeli SC58]
MQIPFFLSYRVVSLTGLLCGSTPPPPPPPPFFFPCVYSCGSCSQASCSRRKKREKKHVEKKRDRERRSETEAATHARTHVSMPRPNNTRLLAAGLKEGKMRQLGRNACQDTRRRY